MPPDLLSPKYVYRTPSPARPRPPQRTKQARSQQILEKQESGSAADAQSTQKTKEDTTRAKGGDISKEVGIEGDDVQTPPVNELLRMSEEEEGPRDKTAIEAEAGSLAQDHASAEGDAPLVVGGVELGDLYVETEISVDGEKDGVDGNLDNDDNFVDDLDGDVSDATDVLAKAEVGANENGGNDEGQEYPGDGDNRATKPIEADAFIEEAPELAKGNERGVKDITGEMDVDGARLDSRGKKHNASSGADGWESNSDSSHDEQSAAGDKQQDEGPKIPAATDEDTRKTAGTAARDTVIPSTDTTTKGNDESTVANMTIPKGQDGISPARLEASQQADRRKEVGEDGQQQQQREEEEEEKEDAGSLSIATAEGPSTDGHETDSPPVTMGATSANTSSASPSGSSHVPPDVGKRPSDLQTAQDTTEWSGVETIDSGIGTREVPWATDSCALRAGVKIMTEDLACHLV